MEVVGRVSTIDLNDGLIEGGEMTDISAAVNWFLNPTTRVEFNYIYDDSTRLFAVALNPDAEALFPLKSDEVEIEE